MSNIPKTTKAVTLGKAEGNPGEVWHPLIVEEKEIPKLKDGQVLVKLHAAALNYREIWIRRSLYPGILHGATMGADGAGILVAPTSHPLYNKPVLITPEVGWHKSTYGPDQPDEDFHVIGGTEGGEGRGALSEYIVVPQDDAVECPSYLVEEKNGWDAAAALPLAAVTAYRACFTKAEVEQGQNVLITGIGGGVAMQALQFCVAKGANVYVTSSKAEKIDQAKQYGAKGGVNYKDEDWPQQLAALLPKERPSLDAVIDAAGGDIITAVLKLLKFGARVAVYGQTTEKPHILTMFAIQKNIELRGTTMGSREEFKKAVQFAAEHKIKPVVHEVYNSLEEADKAMEDLRKGNQLGKLVIRIA